MVGDWGGGGGLTFDSENTKYLFKPRLNKLRNISRQVNFKYIILSCNLQFFSLQEFWCLAKKKRSNGGGYGPPDLPPWSANGAVLWRGSFQCWDYSCPPIARLAESKIETSWERIKSEKEKEKGGKEK